MKFHDAVRAMNEKTNTRITQTKEQMDESLEEMKEELLKL